MKAIRWPCTLCMGWMYKYMYKRIQRLKGAFKSIHLLHTLSLPTFILSAEARLGRCVFSNDCPFLGNVLFHPTFPCEPSPSGVPRSPLPSASSAHLPSPHQPRRLSSVSPAQQAPRSLPVLRSDFDDMLTCPRPSLCCSISAQPSDHAAARFFFQLRSTINKVTLLHLLHLL